MAPLMVLLCPAVPRCDILQLVQLVFTVLTTAMQDDPANRAFFENSVSIIYCKLCSQYRVYKYMYIVGPSLQYIVPKSILNSNLIGQHVLVLRLISD